MRRFFAISTAVLLTSGFWVLNSRSEGLPGFQDFRRIDRMRRLTGQLQSAELLDATRIDPKLVLKTTEEHAGDVQVLWGAAETLLDWPQKRAMYEAAIHVGGTNVDVVLRFGCAAAHHRDFDTALPWFRVIQQRDKGNALPWLVEFWAQRERAAAGTNGPPAIAKFPSALIPDAMQYRDYAADAARARIRLLERMGYSKYAARRLGFMPEPVALWIMRDFATSMPDDDLQPLLLATARSMQHPPTFLVTELVGQTVERAVLGARANIDRPESRLRVGELDTRRDKLKVLLSRMERDIVDMATETEMVRYFDDVLIEGEEAAMNNLANTVRHSN
jgi:hypothetical protein